ncbi:hypothetical protein [Comamonas sp. GB3 AK4-5]|uniref:hypothetical protein n=1 Tax=Comamonas sp. GB3 AK4-5 TaxID=3231487 RepID=UPI00351EEA25
MPISTRPAIYTGLLACTLLLTACKQSADTPVSAPAIAAPADSAIPPAAAAARVVDQLFLADTIGMNLAQVDKLVGPAVRSALHRHQYRVDGCELTLRTDEADQTVQAVEVAITPSCQLSLQPLLRDYAGEPATQLQALNFARFAEMLSGASYYADCLSMCGNAADPVVTLHAEDPRALHLLEFAIEVPLVGDAALSAADHWRKTMETAESETYVLDNRFNCEPQRFAPVVAPAFAPIQPAVFIFGRDLGYGSDDCS